MRLLVDKEDINRNRLDNRKRNLRFVSHKENMRNRKRGLGIYWDRDRGNWAAQGFSTKVVYIGSYKKRLEAIAAVKLFRKRNKS